MDDIEAAPSVDDAASILFAAKSERLIDEQHYRRRLICCRRGR